ncbi:MAG: glycoside-pentoside-hexuronide (GPH):cation symporter [Oscillospiraceae bacterium]|jgi:melibiose permease/lactose/raffinose/galactose permease|nr:glycoside-pentoside-hexuronide (GPH):cation symporter [Oscillospiraceae bacterium]
MDKINAKKQRFSFLPRSRNVWMFSLGTIGRDMAYGLFAGWLMNYIMYTKQLSDAQFATIGIVFVVCRCYDAVIDPFLGGLIDNTRSRFGKFKPWIFAGMIFAAIDLVILFTTPLEGWTFVAFVAVAYVVFSTTFSMNDIAYWGMMPALTSDPNERNQVVTISSICAGLGGGILSLAAPTLTAGAFALGGNAVRAYSLLAMIIAVLFLGFQTFTLAGVKEMRGGGQTEEKAEKVPLKTVVQTVFKNDQLLWACLVFMTQVVGSGVYYALLTMYIYLTYGYDGTMLTAAGMLGILAFPFTFLLPEILKRVSRKKMMAIGVLLVGIGLGIFLLSSFLLPHTPYGLGFWLIAIGGLIMSIGSNGFYLMMIVGIANTVEYYEWKTGERRESMIFSLRPFVAQFGSAITQLVQIVVFLALGLNAVNGKIASLEQDANRGAIASDAKNVQIGEMLAEVPPGTSVALLICMVLVCALVFLLGYWIYHKKYIIDEKKYDEIMAEIKQRKETAAAEASSEKG